MASMIKTGWFGREVNVLMVNDKSVSGVLSEVTDNYIVLSRGESETLIMCHAIIAVQPGGQKEGQ